MARLDQALLQKVARRLGKTPQYIREQVSRRAGREGVLSSAALVMWARDLGIGVASAVEKLPPHVQQQLSVPRVVGPTPRTPPGGARVASVSEQRRRIPSSSASPRNRKWIFVSHASEDKDLAGALVELLCAALDIPADKILCTSVDGFRLRAGTNTDEALRVAVLQSTTLVGLITPASQKSSYVAFELGARWGINKNLIPLTARGVSPGDLKGPLASKNALDCSRRPGVQQLIGDLGTQLKMEVERPEVYEKYLDRAVRAAKTKAPRRRR
jgi:TIR domain-containing protein